MSGHRIPHLPDIVGRNDGDGLADVEKAPVYRNVRNHLPGSRYTRSLSLERLHPQLNKQSQRADHHQRVMPVSVLPGTLISQLHSISREFHHCKSLLCPSRLVAVSRFTHFEHH